RPAMGGLISARRRRGDGNAAGARYLSRGCSPDARQDGIRLSTITQTPASPVAGFTFSTVDELEQGLRAEKYVAERGLATTLFLTLKLQKPLLLEGEAGVGKTEIAKVLAALLDAPLIRLQCYEGLDAASAIYEWDY